MNWMTFQPAARPARSTEGEAHILDYRQRREMEEAEREKVKQLDQANQRSELNSAEARIRAWEKVHHLRMPLDASHPILLQIAAATHLVLADVQAEQKLRAERRATRSV